MKRPYQDRKRIEQKQAGIAAVEFALEEYQDRNIHAPQGNDVASELALDILIALWNHCEEKSLNMEQLIRTARQYYNEEKPPE